MRTFIKSNAMVIIFFLLFGTLFCQQTGEISGKITDEEGVFLPTVSITATSPSLLGKRSILSRADGSYAFPLLPVGVYSLTFELQGFEKLIQKDVIIRLGRTTSINVEMKVGTIQEQVTVISERPLIDKTKADNSFVMNAKELVNVPSTARDIHEILNYTPGVTGVRYDSTIGQGKGGATAGAGSIRGEGLSGNSWLVDGLAKRSADEHTDNVKVNYDSWEEVQVISDPFTPQMGQTMGGIINVVTKSGGNEFHGGLGTSILDHSLRASRQDQISTATEPDNSVFNYFANIGGPILKDKIWFFISNNLWQNNYDQSQTSTIGWLTIPPGHKRVKTNNLFGKLTFAINPEHTFSFSGTYDTLLKQTGGFGVPERYVQEDYDDYAYRLNYRGILGQNTFFEAAIGRSSHKLASEPVSGNLDEAGILYQDINQYVGNVYEIRTLNDRRTDFTSRLTHTVSTKKFGTHEIGAGFLYYNIWRGRIRDFTGKAYDLWPGNGYDAGANLVFKNPGVPSILKEYSLMDYDNEGHGIGLYVSDKVTFRRFTVMLGVRSETEKVYSDMNEPIISWGLGDFIAPRFSLAWDLTGDGVNVLKVGYGQFTDNLAYEFLSLFNLKGLKVQHYRWKGPLNPSTSQLKDPANWSFYWRQGVSGEPAASLPPAGIHPEKVYRYLVEFDRRLGNTWALKLRGVYSKRPDMLEDIAYMDYEKEYYLLENWELKRRTYRSLEVEVNGSISDRFFLNASYVWSQAKGCTPGNYEMVGGWTGQTFMLSTPAFGDRPSGPSDSPFASDAVYLAGCGGKDYGAEGWYGFLDYSADHVVKILGTYYAPYNITVTPVFEFSSGYHYSMRGWSEGYGAYITFPNGRGTEIAPAHTYVDLSVQKDFVLPKGIRLGLRVNITNLLNTQRPLSYVNSEGSLLSGQIFSRQYPRLLQLQLLLEF